MIKILPIEEDVIKAVSSMLEPKGLDYSTYTIIFPGKRPAHFLRKALAEKENKAYIPPKIFSIDEFIDYLYEEKLKKEDRKINAIEATVVLYEILQDKNISDIYLKEFSFDTFLPLGIRLYNFFEELIIELVSGEALKNIPDLVNDRINIGITYKTNEFIWVYKKKLLEKKLSTRSIRYETIWKYVDNLADVENLIFVGFYALTNAETNILKRLLKNEKNHFISNNGPFIKEQLLKLDESLEINDYVLKIPEKLFIYQAPDIHGQILTANNILEKCEKLDENTCFVLPKSESLFPIDALLLSTLNTNFNVSMGYPIIRTPIFGFISVLMQTLITIDNNAFYVPDLLDLLLHPYTKNIKWQGSSENTRMLVHNLMDRLKTTFMTMDDICSFLSNEEKRHLEYIIEKTIKTFIPIENIRDFVDKIISLLYFIEKETTAKNHPLFIPFIEHFFELLEDLKRLEVSNLSFDKKESYFNLLKEIVKSGKVSFPGTPLSGLQVLGFLETRCLCFDRLFIFDANEGILPKSEENDSILPMDVRKTLNLPTYRDREKIAEYYFFTLISKASEVYIFYTENQRDLRSRFIEKIIWERQKKDRDIDDKKYIQKVSYNVLLKEKELPPIEKTDKVIEFLKNLTYSPSAIERYFSCPYAFYYEYVLGLREGKGVQEDIERNVIGNIVHGTLKDFYKHFKGKIINIEEGFEKRIDKEVKRLTEESFGKPLRGKHYLLYDQIKKHLIDFIRFEKEQKDGMNVEVYDLEVNRECEWDGFKLQGKIDRIDKIGNSYHIIDYKTGSSGVVKINFEKIDLEDRENWRKTVKSLQLPIYMILFTETENIALQEVNACYVNLNQVRFNDKTYSYLFEENIDKMVAFEKVCRVLKMLLEEITSKDVPFIPTKDDKICTYCNFQRLCGKRE